MIETESLTIPSPNKIENNFGYLSGLIIVRAATESVAQTQPEYNKIYDIVNMTYSPDPV